MNISMHDRNLIMLAQLNEIITKSLLDEIQKQKCACPNEKISDYGDLYTKVMESYRTIQGINDMLEDQFKKVMSEREQDLLAMSVMGTSLLLEMQNPKQIVRILDEVGIDSSEIYNAFL